MREIVIVKMYNVCTCYMLLYGYHMNVSYPLLYHFVHFFCFIYGIQIHERIFPKCIRNARYDNRYGGMHH